MCCNSKSKGVTLIELLAVIAIVALLATIFYPTMARAVESAKVSKSVRYLQQRHVALMLYREEYDAKAVYGKASDMGLPPWEQMVTQIWMMEQYGGESLWTHSCGFSPHMPRDRGWVYLPNNSEGPGSWETLVKRHKDDMIYLYDATCNGAEVGLSHSYHLARYPVLRLSGATEVLHLPERPEIFQLRD